MINSSLVKPGTVPTAGTKITSAPASRKALTDSSLATGSSTPAPCIFPAIINPEKFSLAVFTALAIILLVTPVPGFPVKQTKLNPSFSAAFIESAVAVLPNEICNFVDSIFALLSTGSRFTPIGRPVSF